MLDGVALPSEIGCSPISLMQNFAKDDRWQRIILDDALYSGLGIARTDFQLETIGRLRYNLFIERDGKRYAHADHSRKIFLEPVDAFSLNFLAGEESKCSVAVRATWASDAVIDSHLAKLVFRSGIDESCLEDTIVNSRMAVEPSATARILVAPLFRSMFRVALIANGRFCLAATRPSLMPLFERFGFRQPEGSQPYLDDIAGWMSVLLLDIHDRKHLERVNSPYLRVLDEFYSQSMVGTDR